MPKKLILTMFLSSLCMVHVFADAQSEQMQQQALKQIESVFAAEQRYMTFSSSESIPLTNLPNIKTTLSTNWDFVIFNIENKESPQQVKSKLDPPIIIDRTAITIDGMSAAKVVNMELKAKTVNKYYFADLKLNDYIRKIAKGYTVFGAFETINANQFLGYSDYKIKPLQITYSWHYKDSNTENISKINLFVVMGKK